MVSLSKQAFKRAWDAACACAHSDCAPNILVPDAKTFLLSAVSFTGPCSYTGTLSYIRYEIINEKYLVLLRLANSFEHHDN